MSTPTITRQSVLRRAAEILPVNKRCVGEYYEAHAELEPSRCPVCVLGAIALAAGCDLDHMQLYNPKSRPEVLAMDSARALADHLNLARNHDDPNALVNLIGTWNDDPERTDAEVLDALRAAADHLDQAEEV